MRNSINDVLSQVHANPNPIHMLLTRAKDNKSYICPFCNNGNSGKSGDGINLSKDGKFYCFKCNAKGDAIDLYRQIKGISSFQTAIAEVAALYNIPFSQNQYNNLTNLTPEEKIRYINDLASLDISRGVKNTNHPDYLNYLKQRAISPQTAKLFNLGYLPNWRHPKNVADNKNMPTSPRLIIPTGENSYTARDIRDINKLSLENQKYIKQKVNIAGIFNSKILTTANKPIFIVEGELDAISFYEIGSYAVALGSTSNVDKLLLALPKYQKELYILALDNDEAGRKASDYLKMHFNERKIKYIVANVTGKYKDANEALQKDKANFIKNVKAAETSLIDNLTCANRINKIKESLFTSKNIIPTPFNNFNNLLSGGFTKGVYFLSSQDGCGKESFLMHLAKNAAINNFDVLIYSATFKTQNLIAQFLSYECNSNNNNNIELSSNDILLLDSSKIKIPSIEQTLKNAFAQFNTYANKITISTLEDNENIFSNFEYQIRRFIHLKGSTPLVILHAPSNYFAFSNDRYPSSDLMYKIKRLSNEYALPILIITDIVYPITNQYHDPISYLLYGTIGAWSDYVMLLHFKEAAFINPNLDVNYINIVNKLKKQREKNVEITILKQSTTAVDIECNFTYNSKGSFFIEK